MNAVTVLLAGIAPEHLPALAAGLLVLVAWLVLARSGVVQVAVPVADQVAAALLAFSAAVHGALPLGHAHSGGLTAGFVGSGVAYGWLAVRALTGRSWRAAAAVLVIATLLAYLGVVGSGGEGPDQVGILTALAELLVLGICLAPRPASSPLPRRTRVAGGLATTGFVAAVLLVGTSVWEAAWAGSDAAGAGEGVATASGDADEHGEHGDDHDHRSRAQAGMIAFTPGQPVTPAQQRAAGDLAARTARSLTRYRDIRAALAAGYAPTLNRTGPAVHLALRGVSGADPERPPMLMYAVEDGRAALLSAVYTAPLAGPPPALAGLHWHTHNGCASLLPPGLGIASPFGDCPVLSVQATLPFMTHVWVVDLPGGALAEHVDKAWVRAYTAEHGTTFAW